MASSKRKKNLIRAWLEQTGGAYAAARRPHDASEPRVVDKDDGTVYEIAPDGRWAAFSPSHPDEVGYGPSQRSAWFAMIERRFEHLGDLRRVNVLTLVEDPKGTWTARATERIKLFGRGDSRDAAISALLRQLPAEPHRIYPEDRFTRTITFVRHDDGRWSANTDKHAELFGWGKDRNLAEIDLMDKEDLEEGMALPADEPDDTAEDDE